MKNEKQVYLQFLSRFKKGNFSNKKKFVDFFSTASDWNIYVLGIRLFMAICSHSDMEMLVSFLSRCSDEQLRVFLAYVPESLTIQAIPFLLALYEDRKGACIRQDIARCIYEILGCKYDEKRSYDINELGDLCISFLQVKDPSKYYFKGKTYFTGDMTKEIISMVIYCRAKSLKFLSDQIPSILSHETGIMCPIRQNTDINSDAISQIYGYVNVIAKQQHIRGSKYFYNHIIV